MAKFNLRNSYLYLVCLVTLIVFIIGTIFTITNLTDLFLDEEYYQTIDEFALRFERFVERDGSTQLEISDAELEQRYQEYVDLEKRRRRNQEIRSFANSLSAMLVGGAFWVYHWRKIENSSD